MTVTKETSVREEALEKGYLQNKKVRLKPIPRRNNAMISDSSHKGYFMWEDAQKTFVLPMHKQTGILISPFNSEDELKCFSQLLDLDLNPYKKNDNYWHSPESEVSIKKTPEFMQKGMEFNLADPIDALRYRVVKIQDEVADSWDKRFEKPYYKFALVDQDFEETENNQEMEMMSEIYIFFGSIKDSPKKMREFLGIYLLHKKSNKEIDDNSSKEFLRNEIQKVIKNDHQTVYSLVKDEDTPIKYFIYKAVKAGVIKKKGVSTYVIQGEDKDHSFKELIEHIKFLKETTDPLYMKIEAQINSNK